MEPNESLQPTITDDQRVALALAISQSDGALPQKLPALAEQLGVSVSDVVDLLNDSAFVKVLKAINKARATFTFSAEALPKLIEIVSTGKEKHKLTAIQMLGKISGDLTPHKIVDMRVTFDDLRKRSTGDADPLANLFEIKADVIEAELKQEAEADDYEQWEADNAG